MRKGYTTYQCLKQFNKQQIARKPYARNHTKKYSNNKTQIVDKPQGVQHQQSRNRQSVGNRPKTAIIARVNQNPTRRRVHHKLSLNQIQKAAVQENILPYNIKQQYFTEQFFDFHGDESSVRQDLTLKNIRCGSRTGTFYKNATNSQKQNTLKKSKFKKPSSPQNNQKKSAKTNIQHHFKQNIRNNINQPQTKKHYQFKSTVTNFYNKSKHNQKRNLCKKIRYHLDMNVLQGQKRKFCQQIDMHLGNLLKKNKSIDQLKELELMENKSIVYDGGNFLDSSNNADKVINDGKNQKVMLYNKKQMNLAQSHVVNDAHKNLLNHSHLIQQAHFQSQLYQQNAAKIIKSIKIQQDISLIQKNNQYLLKRQQLNGIKFQTIKPLKVDNIYKENVFYEFDEKLISQLTKNNGIQLKGQLFRDLRNMAKNYSIKVSTQTEQNPDEISQYTTQSINNKSKKLTDQQHSKQKRYSYTLFLIICSTLRTITLQNILIKQNSFIYKGKQLNILYLVQKMLQEQLPSQFIHLNLIRNKFLTLSQNKQREVNKNSSFLNKCSNPSIKNHKVQSDLVFQTFIHNSDIKFFQGRQVQIQYFKYFLKRFMSLDRTIKTKSDIQSSLSLILSSQIKIPQQFEQFCKQMKIKDPLSIIALRNNNLDLNNSTQQSNKPSLLTFKSIEINLSKLLSDGNEIIMMIKKQLFEGYDWRGVSLKKGEKQFRGYHLQHFYI